MVSRKAQRCRYREHCSCKSQANCPLKYGQRSAACPLSSSAWKAFKANPLSYKSCQSPNQFQPAHLKLFAPALDEWPVTAAKPVEPSPWKRPLNGSVAKEGCQQLTRSGFATTAEASGSARRMNGPRLSPPGGLFGSQQNSGVDRAQPCQRSGNASQ